MSRYIEADSLRKEYNDWYKLFSWGDGTDAEKATIARAIQILDAQPTADVIEVKHGKNICNSVIGHCEFKCSVCGADASSIMMGSLDGGKFNYCPNCGAKMDEREDEDDTKRSD